MPKQSVVPVSGMHCASCVSLIESEIKDLPGVTKVKASLKDNTVSVTHDERVSEDAISAAIDRAGYAVGKNKKPFLNSDPRVYINAIIAGLVVAVFYALIRVVGMPSLQPQNGEASLSFSLILGLVAGVSSCMALIGGLILGVSARHTELYGNESVWQKFKPHLYFNAGRIAGYALLGGIAGSIGSFLGLSQSLVGFLVALAGIAMVVLGINLLEVFPRMSALISLPSSFGSFLLKKKNASYSHVGTMALGALTFFLPCGFTQAAQLYAVSTGSFWQGAGIMAAFAIGTAPGLLSLGGFASIIKNKMKILFSIAGVMVILMGLFTFSNARYLFASTTPGAIEKQVKDAQIISTVYKFKEDIIPNEFTVRANHPVSIVVDVQERGYGCMNTIMIPGLYDTPQSLTKPGTKVIMNFTPTRAGDYQITCAMGVPRGVLHVTQ